MDLPIELPPRYNIAPSQPIAADLCIPKAIANRFVDGGILERTNEVVINKLTQRMLNHKPELEMSVEKAFALLDAFAG